MKYLPALLMASGVLMTMGPLLWLVIVWWQLDMNGPAYHDTYYVVVAPNWWAIAYLGLSIGLIALGFWLRQRVKEG